MTHTHSRTHTHCVNNNREEGKAWEKGKEKEKHWEVQKRRQQERGGIEKYKGGRSKWHWNWSQDLSDRKWRSLSSLLLVSKCQSSTMEMYDKITINTQKYIIGFTNTHTSRNLLIIVHEKAESKFELIYTQLVKKKIIKGIHIHLMFLSSASSCHWQLTVKIPDFKVQLYVIPWVTEAQGVCVWLYLHACLVYWIIL